MLFYARSPKSGRASGPIFSRSSERAHTCNRAGNERARCRKNERVEERASERAATRKQPARVGSGLRASEELKSATQRLPEVPDIAPHSLLRAYLRAGQGRARSGPVCRRASERAHACNRAGKERAARRKDERAAERASERAATHKRPARAESGPRASEGLKKERIATPDLN